MVFLRFSTTFHGFSTIFPRIFITFPPRGLSGQGGAAQEAFGDIEHLLQQASTRARSKAMSELVDRSDLSELRQRALEAFQVGGWGVGNGWGIGGHLVDI